MVFFINVFITLFNIDLQLAEKKTKNKSETNRKKITKHKTITRVHVAALCNSVMFPILMGRMQSILKEVSLQENW